MKQIKSLVRFWVAGLVAVGVISFLSTPLVAFATPAYNTNVGDALTPQTTRSTTDCKPPITKDSCTIVGVVVIITNTLSALAGIVIVGVIVWGGIQYSAAGDETAKVQAAKQKIYNALMALVLLIFGVGLLQWLVPGGIF